MAEIEAAGSATPRVAHSLTEAARMIGVSRVTLHRAKAAGRLPHHRVGDRVLMTDGDIAAFLEARAVPVRG